MTRSTNGPVATRAAAGRARPLVRVGGVIGVAWGGALLLAGDRLWREVAGGAPSATQAYAVRVLGARHLVQGLAQLAAPGMLQRTYVAVDVVHAASMVALAVVDPSSRRPAVVSATVAGVSAGAIAAGRRRRAW